MARRKRSPREQSDHDQQVRQTAAWYSARGYKVKADVAGYRQPPLMNGHIPDIAITRGGKLEKVIEVETASTMEVDVDQRAALKRAAAAKGATFQIKKAQPRKAKKR